jgi:phosphoserine phosphatase
MDFDDSWFYSDSHNDLPLLEAVAHPVAVDPDDPLRAIAAERGWPIRSFRNSQNVGV